MTYHPTTDTTERHYDIDESARRLKMPTRALVERINAGEVETKFNGRRNLISAGEITRVSAELRHEAEATQMAEDERAAQEQRERDGAHIAKLMSEAQELAEKYDYDPNQG